MNTYLIICGAIINILVILFIILVVVSEIHVAFKNKKIRKENEKRREQFIQELGVAKDRWKKFVQKRDSMRRKCKEEDGFFGKSKINADISIYEINHGKFYFASTGKTLDLDDLARQYNWGQ